MHELFLAICALTVLSCDDVNVEYGRVGFDTLAIAAIDNRGGYHIIADRRTYRRESNTFRKQLLVHEIAHLLVYETGEIQTGHGELFDEICAALANEVSLKPRTTCSSHTGTRSHWRSRRRD